MAENIPIDALARTIVKQMEDYTSEIEDDVREAVIVTAKETQQLLGRTSPERTGEYAKRWRVKIEKGRHFTGAIVHNKLYQLVHLLEKGHAKRGGGRVRAFPHVAPAETAAEKRLEKRVEDAIKEAGR